MKRTFSAGSITRAASATCRPFRPPGSPTSVTSRSTRRAAWKVRSPDGPSSAVSTFVARAFEDLDDQLAHDVLVLDHEHGLAVAALRDVGGGAGLVVGRTRGVAGQIQAHRRALPRLRVDAHLPARLPHETVDHRQTEPGALADGLGGEERIEHASDDLGRHAGAVVRHAQRDVLAGRQLAVSGGPLVEPLVGGLDRQAATIGHGVARVDAQVEQRVLELRRIDAGRPEAAGADHLQFHRRPDGSADQLFHAADEPVDIGRLRVEGLPPREGEQPLCQGGGPAHRVLAHADVALRTVGLADLEPPLQHLQAHADALEQVVEVVRDAARELAHGLHLLRLAQGILCVGQPGLGQFALRHVAAVAVDAVAFDGRVPRDPAVRAVLMDVAILEIRDLAVARRLLERAQRALEVVGHDEIGETAAGDVVGTVAQDARPGRVDSAEDAIRVDDDEQVSRVAPDPVTLLRALGDLSLERSGELAQLEFRTAPLDRHARALRHLADHRQLGHGPLARLRRGSGTAGRPGRRAR